MPGGQEYSLTPKRYETFLKSLFDAWYLDVKADKSVYNRYFDNLLMIMDRQVPESCNMRGVCRRNREPVTKDSTGKNYFCDAYKGFFEYAYPRLKEVYRNIRMGMRG